MWHQEIKLLYMVDRSELIEELQNMLQNGYEISAITPLREFREPAMDGRAVTDWLIIFRVQT